MLQDKKLCHFNLLISVRQCTYDHSTFENLENKFVGLGGPQNRNAVLLQDDDPCLAMVLNTQSSMNENEEVHNENNDPLVTIGTTTDYYDGQLFASDDMSTVEPYQSNLFYVLYNSTNFD